MLAPTPGMFTCFKCGEPGHRSSDYPKKKFHPQANLIGWEGIIYDDDDDGDELELESPKLERDDNPGLPKVEVSEAEEGHFPMIHK